MFSSTWRPTSPGYGSHGSIVAKAQVRLREPATGYFGVVTLRKVLWFQRAHHLKVTGRLDTPTLYRLHV